MGQVIRNFLSNSIKFSPDFGSVHINIKWHPDSLLDMKILEDISMRQNSDVLHSPSETCSNISQSFDSSASIKSLRDITSTLKPALFVGVDDIDGINGDFVRDGCILIEFIDEGIGISKVIILRQ